MGARDGMEPEEKSVIDRCLPLVYQKYLNDPKPENMPTLGDLYDCLREQKERQGAAYRHSSWKSTSMDSLQSVQPPDQVEYG